MYNLECKSNSSSPLAVERRAFHRFTPKQHIYSSIKSFSVIKDRQLCEINGEIADISLGGLKFVTKQQLPFVTEDIVIIHINWGQISYELTGKIVWKVLDSGIFNIGIVFEKETRKSDALRKIIQDISIQEPDS